MPSIDVAVPCYQYGRYLRDCVYSILRQDVPGLRILIIDNASTDNSAAIARELASQDSRIELVVRPVNMGLHASFNEGIDWAASDYFTILAADDCLAPGALARAIAALELNPHASFAIGRELQFYGDVCSVREESKIKEDDEAYRLTSGRTFLEQRFLFPGSYQAGFLVVRTQAQKRAGHYRPELPHTDDLEMLLRLSLQGPLVELPAIQGWRREHGSNRSKTYRDGNGADGWHRLAAFESFFRNEGASIPDAKLLHRMARRGLAEWAYWSAISHAVRGHFHGAARLFRLAISLRPGMTVMPPFNYLMRSENPLQRIAAVVSSAAGQVGHPIERSRISPGQARRL